MTCDKSPKRAGHTESPSPLGVGLAESHGRSRPSSELTPSTANELSYRMILALRFFLLPVSTPSTGLPTIRPHAHWFSQQRTAGAVFRDVFPDALLRLLNALQLRVMPSDFLTVHPPSPSESHYAIIIIFFIETSSPPLSTYTPSSSPAEYGSTTGIFCGQVAHKQRWN